MDIEKINVCHDLGITYHEDLGVDKDGFYRDRVRVGPIERIFKINRNLIDDADDLCDNSGEKRLKHLEKKIAELHEEIKSAMNQVGDEVSGD